MFLIKCSNLYAQKELHKVGYYTGGVNMPVGNAVILAVLVDETL